MDIKLIFSIFCIIKLNFYAAQEIKETTEEKEALSMFLKDREKIVNTDEDNICGTLMYEDEKIPGYKNADKICYLAYKHSYITENPKFKIFKRYLRGECKERSVIKTADPKPFYKHPVPSEIHKWYTNSFNTVKADIGLCHWNGGIFYVARTSKKNYYAILKYAAMAVDHKIGEEEGLLMVVAISKLECKQKDFLEMQTYFKKKAIKVEKTQENKIPAKKIQGSGSTSAGKKIEGKKTGK